jgi:ankyrin repeat protein
MASQIGALRVDEPIYYHREYKNDISDVKFEETSLTDQCKRVALVALPFFSLYKPLSVPLSLGMGGMRTFTSIIQVIESIKVGGAKDISLAVLQTGIAVIAFASTVFAHPLGMLISTGHDLVLEISQLIINLANGDCEKAIGSCLGIINNALYLALFLDGGLELAIVSLAVQILIGLYHSQAEFREGHLLEGAGHLVMSMVRGNQLAGQVSLLQVKWRTESTLKQDVNPEIREEYLELLEDAKLKNNQKLVDVLIKYGNGRQGIPIVFNAIAADDFDAVKVLVDNGADINAVIQYYSSDKPKSCPLTVALGRPKILKFLVDSGADVNIRLAQRKTPLHYAANNEKTFDALCVLMEGGANINARDLYGNTPLHEGIRYKKIAFALLDNGADLHALNDTGWKPLHLAYQYSDLELLKGLVGRGASLNEFSPGGGNALHSAIPSCFTAHEPKRQKNKDLVKWLIEENGMNINQHSRWYDGKDGSLTPFMIAIGRQEHSEDNFEILEFLLERGANINLTMHHNGRHIHQSALDWANQQKIPKYIIEWMTKHGAR